MASPLRIFRRYQYALLVGFGIMLMFAFVVAPPLSDYLRTHAERTQAQNPVVVTWRGGELKDFDLANLRTRHLQTMRFLRALENRVEAAEAAPVMRKGEQVSLIKGMTYPYEGPGSDADHVRIVVGGEIVEAPASALRMVMPKVPRVGQAMNDEELVDRLLLADKARALGVVISDTAIEDYLDNLCDASESNRPNYRALLQRATNGRLDYRQFHAQMAIELAAQRMEVMASGGLLAAPPELLYECYNRLNRQATVELLALDVADFVQEVPEPTEADIAALYEEGKDEFPDPLLPDPGFKQRKRIAFGYFVGVFEEFLQREVDAIRPTITDARIETYYEDNKTTEFKVLELPSDEPESPADAPAAQQEPAPDAAAPDAAPTPPADGDSTPAAPADAPPSEPPSAGEPAAPPESAPPPPTSEPQARPEPEQEPEPAAPPSTQPDTPPVPSGSQGRATGAHAETLQLVSYQTPDPAAPPQDPPTQEQEEGPSLPDGTDQPEGPAAEPTEAGPAETAPASTQEPPAAGPPAAEAGAATPESHPVEGESAEPAPPEPVKSRPLDDQLRDEIRTRLARLDARQPAQEKLEKAIEEARVVVERYARQVTRAKASPGAEPPTPPDFQQIAENLHLVHQQTPLWDVLDIAEIRQADPAEDDPPGYELARATEMSLSPQMGVTQRTLAEAAFGDDIALFLPRRLVDGGYVGSGQQYTIPPDKLFLYWREQVVPEQVPPLEEVRSQVVKVWKLQQALPRARARAESMAKQAADAARPLTEVFADNATHVITTHPFTWMTRGALPGSLQQAPPRLSTVTGTTLDGQRVTIFGAGQDFMRAVFDLDVGQVGVAVNQPQKFVYIVRVVDMEPGEQQRRDAFFAAGLTPEVLSLVRTEHGDILHDWYESLKKELAVDWKRKPERDWRFE